MRERGEVADHHRHAAQCGDGRARRAGADPVSAKDEQDGDHREQRPLLARDRQADEQAGGEWSILERAEERPGGERGGQDLLRVAPVQRVGDERIEQRHDDDEQLPGAAGTAGGGKPREPERNQGERDQARQRSPPVDADRAIAERDPERGERHTKVEGQRPHRRLVGEEAGKVAARAGADRRPGVSRIIGEADRAEDDDRDERGGDGGERHDEAAIVKDGASGHREQRNGAGDRGPAPDQLRVQLWRAHHVPAGQPPGLPAPLPCVQVRWTVPLAWRVIVYESPVALDVDTTE